jgi:hypothetical protein
MYLFNDRENPWFVVIISVCSNTKVNLLSERIRLVRRSQFENTFPTAVSEETKLSRGLCAPVGWSKRDIIPCFWYMDELNAGYSDAMITSSTYLPTPCLNLRDDYRPV